jgi:hypothetical protein
MALKSSEEDIAQRLLPGPLVQGAKDSCGWTGSVLR